MELDALLDGLDAHLTDAVQTFWLIRESQRSGQIRRGRVDAGMRGAVTGGAQMVGLERLVAGILRSAGLPEMRVHLADRGAGGKQCCHRAGIARLLSP